MMQTAQPRAELPFKATAVSGGCLPAPRISRRAPGRSRPMGSPCWPSSYGSIPRAPNRVKNRRMIALLPNGCEPRTNAHPISRDALPSFRVHPLQCFARSARWMRTSAVSHRVLTPSKANTKFSVIGMAIRLLATAALRTSTSSIVVENFLVKYFNRRSIAGHLIKLMEFATGR